jgi:hypothetical protein
MNELKFNLGKVQIPSPGLDNICDECELKAENRIKTKALDEVWNNVTFEALNKIYLKAENLKFIELDPLLREHFHELLLIVRKALAATVAEAQPESKPCKCEEYRQALEEVQREIPDFKTYFKRNNVSITQQKWRNVCKIIDTALAATPKPQQKGEVK